LECLAMEDTVIFNGILVCIFCGHWVYFPRFGIFCHEKSGNRGEGGGCGISFLCCVISLNC
jgi:hypothetical protein